MLMNFCYDMLMDFYYDMLMNFYDEFVLMKLLDIYFC
jgi:hypothetical protein